MPRAVTRDLTIGVTGLPSTLTVKPTKFSDAASGSMMFIASGTMASITGSGNATM